MSFFQCLIPKLIRRALKAVTKMKFLKTTKKKKKRNLSYGNDIRTKHRKGKKKKKKKGLVAGAFT